MKPTENVEGGRGSGLRGGNGRGWIWSKLTVCTCGNVTATHFCEISKEKKENVTKNFVKHSKILCKLTFYSNFQKVNVFGIFFTPSLNLLIIISVKHG
jgi:hypothetical protein